MSLVNQKFGKLTVLREVRKGNRLRKIYWDCLCDCGKETNVYGVYLLNGDTKSCGCLKTSKKIGTKKPKSQEHYHKASAKVVYSASYQFEGDTISFDDFYRLSQMNCYYCKSKPLNTTNAYRDKRYLPEAREHGKFIYNGLDRVNNDLPHTLENCVPCCKFCNYSKRTKSEEMYKQHCNSISDFKSSEEFLKKDEKFKELVERIRLDTQKRPGS